MTSATLLEVKHLQAAYGASQVLYDIDFSMRSGEVVTLLGRNGMGKTTTVKTLMGVVPTMAGSACFQGGSITGLRTDQIARLGIAVVPEGRSIFPNLTVEENLIAYAANRSNSPQPWTLEKIYEFFPRLRERSSNMGNELSGGEQQMLAIGRALLTNPHLLVLDEATEGLAPLIRAEIWAALSQLKTEGLAQIVIDKNLDALLPLADFHYVIKKGRVVWSGTSIEARNDVDIVRSHLSV